MPDSPGVHRASSREEPSSEYTPLLAKSDSAHGQMKERSRMQTAQIYFLTLLFFGVLLFFIVFYYVYSIFIAGILRCESGKGKLILENAMLSNLKNEGILAQLDANDPYIVFQFDGTQARTSVFPDSVTQNLHHVAQALQHIIRHLPP